MATEKSNFYPSIDMLRGFAAISVVIYHVIEHYTWSAFPSGGPLVWFRIGWMGVDLFFVISGFVIGLSAFSEIDRSESGLFRQSFIRRRIIRIAPLYFLTCLVFIVFISPELLFEKLFLNGIAHIFFIHNLIPAFHGSINGVNWSLGPEMQFYFLMLLFAPWLRIAHIWKFLLVFFVIAWAWRLGAIVLIPSDGPRGPHPLFLVSTQLPGMLDEFAIGLVIARLVRSSFGTRLLEKVNGMWLIILAAIFLWGTLFLYWKNASYWDLPWMVVFFRTLLACAFGIIILAACNLNNKNWLTASTPLRYLGTISFGIYLWHLPILLSLKRITWLTPDKALPFIIGLTILFSAISWHFFEKPIIERFARK